MAIDIELACNLIQAKIATLRPQYVANVPDIEHYFTSLDDSLCPYVMTWPGEGSWYQKGGGYKIDQRTYNVYCFVEALTQKDIPARTHQGIQILQAVRNLFIVAANIPLADFSTTNYQITVQSDQNTPHSDSGLIANMPFGNTVYSGFILRLGVRTQWQV